MIFLKQKTVNFNYDFNCWLEQAFQFKWFVLLVKGYSFEGQVTLFLPPPQYRKKEP